MKKIFNYLKDFILFNFEKCFHLLRYYSGSSIYARNYNPGDLKGKCFFLYILSLKFVIIVCYIITFVTCLERNVESIFICCVFNIIMNYCTTSDFCIACKFYVNFHIFNHKTKNNIERYIIKLSNDKILYLSILLMFPFNYTNF